MRKRSYGKAGISPPATRTLVLQVKVQPRSSQQQIVFTGEKECRIWIHSAPDKGKANREVIQVLSDHFGIAGSHICIIGGEKSRNKRIEVTLPKPIRKGRHVSDGGAT